MDVVSRKMITEIDEIEKNISNRPTSNYSEENTIYEKKTVSEIRDLYYEYAKQEMITLDGESSSEDYANYLDSLIHLGKFEKIFEFCKRFNKDFLKEIFNVKPYNMYYGTVLHSTLYTNTGCIAKELYMFFRENGAIPYQDYYGSYPWEQTGIMWTCIPNKCYLRDNSEFSETYEWVKKYENSLKNVSTNQSYIKTKYYSDDDETYQIYSDLEY